MVEPTTLDKLDEKFAHGREKIIEFTLDYIVTIV